MILVQIHLNFNQMKTRVSKEIVMLLITRALLIQKRLKAKPIEMIENKLYEDLFINSKHVYIGQ